MATLTEVSGIARKAIKYGIIGIIVLSLIPVVAKGISNIWLRLHPPPPAAPTVRYGKLPSLIFPSTPNATLPSFTLQTISGNLPTDLPSVGKVYLVGINKSRLSSLDRIRQMAKTLGFTNDFTQLDERNYRFVHSTVPAEMKADIVSWGFSYRYDWTSEKAVATTHSVPVGNEAIVSARSFFQRLGLMPDDLSTGNGKVQYLAATGSAMVPTETFYEANFTRVDLFRADKDKMRIMTTGGDTSPVNVTFTSLQEDKAVAQANYQYSLTVDNDFSTYPLKSVDQAWKELTGGNGYIAKRSGENVIVRKVTLGYYESNEPQEFLQPIFVFEGDNGFIGYVQAITANLVSTPSQ